MKILIALNCFKQKTMRYFILSVFLLAAITSSFAKDWKIRKDVLIYEAVVSGRTIKIFASEQAFDPSKHETTELANLGSEKDPNWAAATIDGKPVLGTDQTLPPKGLPQLSRLVVHFGTDEVEVPAILTSNVFLPQLRATGAFTIGSADSIVSVSTDAKCVFIDLGIGDGGGASTAFFAVSDGGKASTEPPRRPGS